MRTFRLSLPRQTKERQARANGLVYVPTNSESDDTERHSRPGWSGMIQNLQEPAGNRFTGKVFLLRPQAALVEVAP